MKCDDSHPIVCLALISGRKQKDALLTALSSSKVQLINIIYGEGTVQASYLKSLLGLVPEEHKVVMMGLMLRENADAVFQMLTAKFNFDKPNTGIAFTMPVERLMHLTIGGTVMEQTSKMKSLFIVVNAGYANDVIDIARAAGAQGATIINARGESAPHKMIMGITVDAEKELILCVLEEGIADRVMAAVSEKAGYHSPAHTVCFVMPVDKISGFSLSSPEADA